jgi:hypothetical protein
MLAYLPVAGNVRTSTASDRQGKVPNRFGRGLGLVLILIGIGILATAVAGEERSSTTALLGGAVLMSGLMTRTDARRHLARRLAFAALGMLLMGLYMLNR